MVCIIHGFLMNVIVNFSPIFKTILITKFYTLIIYIMIMILFPLVNFAIKIGILDNMVNMEIIRMIMIKFLILYNKLLLIFIIY